MDFYKMLKERAVKKGIEKFVTGSLVINNEGKILILTRKPNDFLGGNDELPGGNAEKDEGIYEAMIRELKEETNFDTTKVVSYVNHFDYMSGSGKRSRQFNFVVEVANQDVIVLTEHDGYKWLTVEECLENDRMSEETREVIATYGFNRN